MFSALVAGIGLAGVSLMSFTPRFIRRRRIERIEQFVFPRTIASKVKEHFPHLSDTQVELVIKALRQYFILTVMARDRMVSMPSKAVDAAWHEFILFTRAYEVFCRKNLGRFLHHTPAEAMAMPTLAQDGIKLAWKLACQLEQLPAKNPYKLPLLFAIDNILDIPGGYKYALDCETGVAPGDSYCASHIGCGSGCGGGANGCGGDGGSDGGGDGGGGCGGD